MHCKFDVITFFLSAYKRLCSTDSVDMEDHLRALHDQYEHGLVGEIRLHPSLQEHCATEAYLHCAESS